MKIKLVDWILNEAGEEFGELEVALHIPLYPITEYHFQVSANLWRGSWPDAATLNFLAARGVKRIFNLCAEREEFPTSIFEHIHYPIVDNTPPEEKFLDDFIAYAKQADPLYVHCEQGKGRTGCMVAAYRVRVQGWSPEIALHEAVNFGLAFPAQKDWILAL